MIVLVRGCKQRHLCSGICVIPPRNTQHHSNAFTKKIRTRKIVRISHNKINELNVVQQCETQKVRVSNVRWAHTASGVEVGEWSLGQWIVGINLVQVLSEKIQFIL